MSATQQITGLVSGFDTATIIEQLMSIEKTSYNKVSEKVEAEKLKLQAYQSVNTMLKSFADSVSSLSSSSLWNSKTTSSSNESSITASATQYAVNGSYSLRAAQLASTAQYMTKGYSSATATVLSSSSGADSTSITLESSKAKVDNSARLEDLNGGKGIYRGSIRITDASGATTQVDLSACETVDEVVKEINNAAGIQVSAAINDAGDGLTIVDNSGGAGALRIQNIGQGATATDLGIAGSSTDVDGVKTLAGSSINYLSSNTALSALNDGLGVEEGMMCVTVKNGSHEVDVYADLSGLEALGDVLNAVNSAIAGAASADGSGLLDGLALAINGEGDGLAFTGGKAGGIYTVTNVWGQDEMAKPLTVDQLGLLGTYAVENDGDSFGGSRILGGLDSPMLKNLSGSNLLGVGSGASNATVSDSALGRDTLLKNLNGGAGANISSSALQIRLYEGGGDSYRQFDDILDYNTLRAVVTTDGATLGDLCDYVNQCFSSSGVPALEGLELKIDSTAKGVYLDGVSSAHDYLIAGTLAESLGIVYMDAGNDDAGWGGTLSATDAGKAAVAELYSSSSLGENGNMILEGTTLNDLHIGGVQITQEQLDAMLVDGGLKLTIGSGEGALDISVDLSGLSGDTTVEDLYTYVNTMIYNAVQEYDPGMSSPFMTIDYTSTGLWWRNVDLAADFTAEGGLADLLGLAKTYDASAAGVAAYSTPVQKNLNPVTVGTAEPTYIAASDSLASLNAGSGLSLLGDKLTPTFGEDGASSIVSATRDELIEALGGNFGAATMNEYLTALNNLFAAKIAAHFDLAGSASVTFGPSSDGKGITIIAAAGRTDGETITLGGGMATAESTGLAAASVAGGGGFAEPAAADIRAATTTEVPVSGLGYINLSIDGATVTLDTDGLSQDSTLNDLLRRLNNQVASLGLSFAASDSGSGIALSNNSSKSVTVLDDEACGLAADLGLAGKTVSANGHLNGLSLNRNYIGRATSLSSLNNGAGADTGVISVTNAQGTSVNIDLSDAKTVGDVIDAVNGTLYGVKARINDAGDGIVIEQTVDSKADGAGETTGNISVASADGSKTAEHLGLAGAGAGGAEGLSVLDGSFKTVVTVNAGDTLTDIMNRISGLDAGYKTSIVNDGTGANSYRLSITAAASGAGSDFIIDSGLDFLGFQQVAKGQDSIVLYGDANSGMSPIMLKSATNSNNQAIVGLTLDLASVSDSYTTITVNTDTEAVATEIQNLVQCYNDLSDLITYLDSYDAENDTDGILFGDSNIRNLMSGIDELFYQVYNPNNLSYADIASADSRVTWTWMDLGISFSTNNSDSDGSSGTWYSRMELDLDALNDMVTNSWDTLQEMLSGTRNVSNSALSQNVAASSTFNWQYDRDENGNIIYPDGQSDPNAAINGDKSGSSSGFTANKTIADGENQYSVYFQQAATLERISIYHQSGDTALEDFTVEYLNASTGLWETLREVSDNSSTSTIIGLGETTTALGIRITATSTNADDGKFRLLDVQCLESTGLAGKLNQVTKSLTDVIDGFFVTVSEDTDGKIADLQERMEKMQERLDAKEASLWSKFTAMETALSQLQNQSDSLTSMLSSLPTTS